MACFHKYWSTSSLLNSATFYEDTFVEAPRLVNAFTSPAVLEKVLISPSQFLTFKEQLIVIHFTEALWMN